VGVLWIVNGTLSPSQVRKVEPFSLVREPLAGELAERFRPWLLFDSKEKWRPLDVDAMFEEGTQRFCQRHGHAATCVPIHSAGEFDTLISSKQSGAASYIDIAGDSTGGYHGPDACRPLLDCNGGSRSAIYYHATESNGRYYLDYWWFLRFNHFTRLALNDSCRLPVARESGICDEHEGDWEGMTVVTRPHDERHVEYVVYAAHKGTFRYSATQLDLRDGTRPVVYLAEGSHAAYPLPCRHACHQPAGLAVNGVIELPEADHDGMAPWGRDAEACMPNARGSCLLSLDKQSWTRWPGEWGAGCTAACGGALDANSPHSPGVQARFQTPWCSFQEDLFTCDGRSQRCADWLGSQVVAVACDPILLTNGQRSAKKLAPSGLSLQLAGQPVANASTPGVVQALGAPLEPGAHAVAVADGPATEVLVRAAQGKLVTDARFADDTWRAGQRVHIAVTSGTDGPTILADGRPPLERTITERPTPEGVSQALRSLGPGG
jgi:Vacuolar protein sorting-associated protein 62